MNLFESNAARYLAIKHFKEEISRAEKEVTDYRFFRKNEKMPILARFAAFMLEKSNESIIYWCSFLLKKYEN